MDSYTENVLSLCSGVGQLDLGYRLACPKARTVCYVEIEAFVQQVLVARIEDQLLDDAPIWSDLKTFDGSKWCGVVDTIIGGFPCQPFSDAGKKRGVEDSRHLWPHIAKLIGVIRPSRCLFENVPGLLSTRDANGEYAIEIVKRDLQEMGYRVEIGLFSAEEVGAPHRRLRVFILADTERKQDNEQHNRQERYSKLGQTRGGTGSQNVRLGNGQTSTSGADSTSRDNIWRLEDSRRQYGRERSEVSGILRGESGDGDSRTEPERPDRAPLAYTEGLVESESVISERSIGERNSDGESPSETRDPSGDMGGFGVIHDSDNKRLQGRWANGELNNQWRTWPPSPKDEHSWAKVIREYPELAPATEKGTQRLVRGVADGLDTTMDTSLFAYRQDRLRAVGNGVVPLTVALAVSVLSRRMNQ